MLLDAFWWISMECPSNFIWFHWSSSLEAWSSLAELFHLLSHLTPAISEAMRQARDPRNRLDLKEIQKKRVCFFNIFLEYRCICFKNKTLIGEKRHFTSCRTQRRALKRHLKRSLKAREALRRWRSGTVRGLWTFGARLRSQERRDFWKISERCELLTMVFESFWKCLNVFECFWVDFEWISMKSSFWAARPLALEANAPLSPSVTQRSPSAENAPQGREEDVAHTKIEEKKTKFRSRLAKFERKSLKVKSFLSFFLFGNALTCS